MVQLLVALNKYFLNRVFLNHSVKQLKLLQIITSILIIILSVVFVAFIHQYFHFLFSIDNNGNSQKSLLISNFHSLGCISNSEKPISIIAGPVGLLLLSTIATTLLNYFPRNLLVASIAMTSALARLGPVFILLIQMVIYRYQPTIMIDELLILNMMNFKDMAFATAVLFFYLMILCVLFILSIRIYEAKYKMKWITVIVIILLQIVVNFYLKDDLIQFLLS